MPRTARTARPLVPTGLSPVTGTVRRVDRTNDPVGDDPSGDTTDDGSRGATERLLNGLNDAQRHAVTLDATHLRILAGAGSGKTRVLTHRIAYRAEQLTLDPQRTLAVTFTRKAAGELRDRLGRLLSGTTAHAGTFHAIAYAQLRQRWEERGVRAPELLERKLGFVARLLPRSPRNSTLALDVLAELEWASARRISPADYPTAAAAARREPPLDAQRIAEILQDYADRKLKQRVVDFDDLLRLAARDLSADPVYAAARHWRFRHLFVDEFQDVNPLQFHLLTCWLGPDSDLCIVGDPNQAIYAWNGADAGYLEHFDRHYPGAESVALEDNYRSTPQILTVANAVLAQGPRPVITLRPHRPAGPLPTVTAHADEVAEARAVTRAARDAHRPGVPWSQQAVLVRTNAQTAAIAEAFTKAGIPHRVRGSANLLELPEVVDAVNQIRRASSLEVALRDLDTELRDAPSQGTLSEERAANVAEILRLGGEFRSLEPSGTVSSFVGWLTSTLRNEDVGSGDAVDVVTFHAAKGLEWAVVHVAGLEAGYVPIHHTQGDQGAEDEERRLLYVALTRAREQLHCTWAERRTFGSRTAKRSPSPWLGAIESVVHVGGGELTRPQQARRAATARSSVRQRAARRELNDEDQEVFERLRAWRSAQAKAADVPAFVIFNDATLTAVASARPSSRAELLGLPGIGPVKVERFGDELLAIIADA